MITFREMMKLIIIVFSIMTLMVFAIFINLLYVKSNIIIKEDTDSIKKENSELIIKVKDINKLKDEEIKQLESLSNDSVLSVFYKHIRK